MFKISRGNILISHVKDIEYHRTKLNIFIYKTN